MFRGNCTISGENWINCLFRAVKKFSTEYKWDSKVEQIDTCKLYTAHKS